MADTNNKIIRQISTDPSSTYDIAAKYLYGREGEYSLSDIISLVHGTIDTYVIKTQSNPSKAYENIVYSEASNIEDVTFFDLSSLVGDENNEISLYFKVGDIILMEESSDGKKIFDRWISNISGSSIMDYKYTLSVLETQVATHHHTITVSDGQAIVGLEQTPTTNNMATVDTDVKVVVGTKMPEKYDKGDVVTSIAYSTDDSNKGSFSFDISLVDASVNGAVSHTHTVDNHDHTVTITSGIFDTVSAYTILSGKDYETHTHNSNVNVAGAATSSSFQYVTGVKSDATFVKSLTTSSKVTELSEELETSTQVSGSSKGSSVMTASSGKHTHTATVTTGTNVITSVDLANTVVTSVSFNAGGVQNTVVTDVKTSTYNTVVTSWKTANTSSFVSSWSCSVDGNGVLSFLVSSANAVTDATKVTASSNIVGISSITSDSQYAPSLSVSSVSQSSGNDSVTLTVSVEESGAHQHGFTHTHTISGHTHGYVGTVVSETGSAITSLDEGTWNTHTHADNVNVASTPSANTFTAIYGGEQTSVLQSVISTKNVITTTSKNLTLSTVYHAVSGDIEFPGLEVGYKDFDIQTITPAKDSQEKPIMVITPSSSNFITSVNEKTSENKGGK